MTADSPATTSRRDLFHHAASVIDDLEQAFDLVCGIGGHVVHSGENRAPGRRHVIHQTAGSEERTIVAVDRLVQTVDIEIDHHANLAS